MRPLFPLLLLSVLASCKPSPREVRVAVASSLREVMPQLVLAYRKVTPSDKIELNYGASGDLSRMVDVGAPVDAVVFAGREPLDRLVAEEKVDKDSIQTIARNELVLAGPTGGAPLTFETLTALQKGDRLAVGDPRTVPAGQYAKEYLTALGEWEALSPFLVYGPNVGALLVYTKKGEARAAIVYRTELRSVPDVAVLDVAKGDKAPHPVVVGALVHGARHDASGFMAFIGSPPGQKILGDFGFIAP
jgi:molybdate transport system substrate-binding protein